jgi:hypothetical protein
VQRALRVTVYEQRLCVTVKAKDEMDVGAAAVRTGVRIDEPIRAAVIVKLTSEWNELRLKAARHARRVVNGGSRESQRALDMVANRVSIRGGVQRNAREYI